MTDAHGGEPREMRRPEKSMAGLKAGHGKA